MLVGKDGIQLHKNKIEAITKLPPPRFVKALKRLFGMIVL